MGSRLERRIRKLEQSHGAPRRADARQQMVERALQHLSEEDLEQLILAHRSAPTPRIAAAIGAYHSALERECAQAGFSSVEQFRTGVGAA